MISNRRIIKYNGRVLFCFIIWIYSVITASDYFPVILTFPVFVVCAWRLGAIKSTNFLVQDMFWVVLILFFVVSPNQNIKNYKFISGPTLGIAYDSINFFLAQSIVFLSLLVISYFDWSAEKRVRSRDFYQKKSFPKIDKSKIKIIFFVCCISIGFFILFSGGIDNVISPRREKNRDEMSFIATPFLAMLAVGCMLIVSNNSYKGFCRWIFILLSCSALFLAVNPLNSPRFFNLATWFPLLMISMGDKFSYRRVYFVIVIGILVVMPITSLTSRGGIDAISQLMESAYAESIYRVKDMDVFDTLVHAVAMMSDRSYMFGENLIAIILFFVPRSFFEMKPIVGGLVVGQDLYSIGSAGTDNLSFFFGGDFYMDFGFLGVLLGAVAFGYFWRKYLTTNNFSINGVSLMSCIVAGSIPILVRGPLGAVIGYFVCLVISVYVYRMFFNFRLKNKPN